MVQINLPKNSQVKKGKYFKDKTGSKNLRKVNVYRWDPSSGENPRIDTYENTIKKSLEGSDLVIIHTEWNDFKSLNFKKKNKK